MNSRRLFSRIAAVTLAVVLIFGLSVSELTLKPQPGEQLPAPEIGGASDAQPCSAAQGMPAGFVPRCQNMSRNQLLSGASVTPSVFEHAPPPPIVISLDVTRQTQEKSLWCWAALTSMLARYEGYNFSQSDVVRNRLGAHLPNQTASMLVVRDFLRGISNSTTFANAQVVNPDFYMIYNQIVIHGRPVPLTAYATNGTNLGHGYIVYAIVDNNYVYMHDPWSTSADWSNVRVSSTQLANGWVCVAIGHTTVNAVNILIY